MDIIKVKNLKKYFPIRRGVLKKTTGWAKAVDGVSITIKKGETVGLVGESGCGKTTLAKLTVKLLELDEGEIYFKDAEVSNLSYNEFRKYREHIQIVFQDPYNSLDPRFRVEKILAEPLESFRKYKNKKVLRNRILELLNMVGLSEESISRFPHQFSGGQRQRIGIARAISLNPEVLILDEPVSSLDVSIQAQIINLLSELQEKMDLTYLFIAHDLRVVRQVSDEICVMYRGRIVEKTNCSEIFNNPLHPYTKLLLSSLKMETGEEKEEYGLYLGGCNFHPRCPKAKQACKKFLPELKEVKDGHFVRCDYI